MHSMVRDAYVPEGAEPADIIFPVSRTDAFGRHTQALVLEWYSTGEYSLSEITKRAFAEGFSFRGSGARVPKSSMHKILNNPIYFGEFDWDSKRYKGVHEPLISRESVQSGSGSASRCGIADENVSK